MSKIIIRNIGPISEVEIELNKINIVIGPQSSGKSTIAKIISFCQWVEKRFILDGKFEYSFEEQFIDFHRIGSSYFREDSFFSYESEFVYVSHAGRSFKLNIKRQENWLHFRKSKNIYIPAERNFVSVIPNLGKYNETNDNIMSFLYDWFDAKRKYAGTKSMDILDLGVAYSYSKESDSDILKLKNSGEELYLKNASSGLQSVVPLLMLIDYLSNEIFHEKKAISVIEKEANFKIFLANRDQIAWNSSLPSIESASLLESLRATTDPEGDSTLEWLERRAVVQFANFIVEEPEQNLFPATQRDLIYFLFEKLVNGGRPHSLFITTHSPYILYAINNCLMGGVIREKMPLEEQEELRSHAAWIDPSLVSVWEIKNGGLVSIIDPRTKTVTKHYFNEISKEIMDEYYDMLNYFEYDPQVES